VTTLTPGLLERGVVAAERGRVAEGLALIREACAADPSDAEAQAQLARWLLSLHRATEAVAAAERALALRPTMARTFDTVGVVFSHVRQHERALECFERALRLEPQLANAHFNLAASLKFLGRFEAAERAYESCLRCEPDFWRAHSALAQTRTQTSERNHIGRLNALVEGSDLTPDAGLHLRHALAKELEDIGRYAEAFEQLVTGKALKRPSLGYDFARDQVLFETAARVFSENVVAPPDPVDAAEAPIFVVGMPRTGTTLVERIVSSHPRVASAGESQNFGILVKRAAATPLRRVLDVATLERAMTLDLPVIGQAYLAQTRPDSPKPRFVDKMPLNFFYLGALARALPLARFVVLRRDPLDTCLSNFRQLFALGFSYYDYSFDLLDTGRYYAAFDRLIEHWQQVLPGRLLQVKYEALVDDQRGETARLLRHCGLEWDARCLDFDRNPDTVSTASAVQVRKPIYRSGVGRWRHYAAQLESLRTLLRSEGIAIGS
jgi:tetratricopeptide (TPR) repeat protein